MNGIKSICQAEMWFFSGARSWWWESTREYQRNICIHACTRLLPLSNRFTYARHHERPAFFPSHHHHIPPTSVTKQFIDLVLLESWKGRHREIPETTHWKMKYNFQSCKRVTLYHTLTNTSSDGSNYHGNAPLKSQWRTWLEHFEIWNFHFLLPSGKKLRKACTKYLKAIFN